MKRPPPSLLVVLAILVLYSLWAPPVYFMQEIEATIVDSRTGAPIGGVTVVAEWQMYGINLVSAGSGGAMNVVETTTDAEGRFHIPRWGPMLRPPLAYFRERAPQFVFFKSGYYVDGGGNNHDYPHDWIRASDYDGTVIRLDPFDGDFVRLSKTLLNYDPWLGCWEECPHYVVALSDEAARLRKFVPPNIRFFAYPQEIETMSQKEQSYFNRYGR